MVSTGFLLGELELVPMNSFAGGSELALVSFCCHTGSRLFLCFSTYFWCPMLGYDPNLIIILHWYFFFFGVCTCIQLSFQID